MTNPFYKAKFDRLVLNHDSYFIQIDSKGILLTKICGAGDEKDCDAEMSWDEIYESCHIESPLPSKATVDYLAKMEKDELVEALKEIAKGEGAYSLDPLKHSTNTIENMKFIAKQALSKAQGGEV